MLLHHQFIDVAKQFTKKLAIHDLTTNRELTYSKSLIACLILAPFFRKLDKGVGETKDSCQKKYQCAGK